MKILKKKTLPVKEANPDKVCLVCNGTGRDKPEATCPACNGTGK